VIDLKGGDSAPGVLAFSGADQNRFFAMDRCARERLARVSPWWTTAKAAG